MAAAVAAGAAERLLRRDYDWRTATGMAAVQHGTRACSARAAAAEAARAEGG